MYGLLLLCPGGAILRSSSSSRPSGLQNVSEMPIDYPNQYTYNRLYNFSLSIVMTLLPVRSSTRANDPLVSLIVPTYPL